MNFNYDSYGGFLNHLRDGGYAFVDYFNWRDKKRCVILRHDVDFDIIKAHRLALFERDAGVISTYFVIITSDFYNVFASKNVILLKEIVNAGHKIGLHFDEMQYPKIIGDIEAIKKQILWEAKILSEAIGEKIRTVSMHRPSKAILDADISIPGIENSYSKTYFKDFKYLSDSRRWWREPVEEIIEGRKYDRLHILTHAFWYQDDELDLYSCIKGFVNRGNWHRYMTMNDNFTNLAEVMPENEVDGIRGAGVW